MIASLSAAAQQVNVATPGHGLIELAVVVAMRNGYFRSEGLEIQKIRVAPDVAVRALIAGEIDISLGWEASVRAAISGVPIKLVAVTATRPLHFLISRPEVRSGKDLRGKTLGVDFFSSTTDYLSRVAARFLGVEPDKDVAVVEIGNGTSRLEALKAGDIHLTAIDVAIAVKMEEEGFKRLVHIGDIIDLPVSGVFVTNAKLATHKERIKKFIQATLRGARFIKQNRTDAVRMIQSYLKILPSQAARAYDSSLQSFTDDGFVSDRALSLAVRRARESVQIANEPSLSQVADWQVLREIMVERKKRPFWLRQYDP
jgi:ABC-type nitrate/sulfonate/bicarbonate transport system substrate-binding protein